MKIKRNVNGQEMEFELTGNEMWQAYREQEHLFLVEDVRGYIEEMDGVPELTEEQIDRVIDLVTEWMDKNDNISETRWAIVDDAIEEVLEGAEYMRRTVVAKDVMLGSCEHIVQLANSLANRVRNIPVEPVKTHAEQVEELEGIIKRAGYMLAEATTYGKE